MKPGVILDLDQTLSDTRIIAHLRKPNRWKEAYSEIPKLVSFPFIDDLIKFCNNNGILVIIITTSPSTYCSKIISHFKWQINGTICYHDVSRIKPDPESFLKAIKDYDLDIKRTISAGDREMDILASKTAKIPSIGCLWASDEVQKLVNSKPEYIAKTSEELFNIIKSFHSSKNDNNIEGLESSNS